jgi:hypothetical protein
MKRRKKASGGRQSRETQPPNTRTNRDASYICDACGEEIVIPLDPSQGSEQEYVEDCPVCCRPNVIHVEFDDQGESRVWAERE